MPRRLLLDGRIVDDEWELVPEPVAAGDGVPGSAGDGVPGADMSPGAALIVRFDRFMAERERWLAREGRLGVMLAPAHKVEHLAADLPRLALVAAEFPGPSDGRGYTQGRLLRERYGFKGELRASGYVRRDQLFFLARCGFNAFELPESELSSVAAAFKTFSFEYQPSNDAGLGLKLRHRR